jgi:hypothetical protein
MSTIKTNINLIIEDVFKFVTILMIMHILFFCIDGIGEFFDENIIKGQIYCMVGIIVYHLIIKKIIKIDKYTNNNNKNI